MRYRKKRVSILFIAFVVLMIGCGTKKNESVSGTNYYYPEKETEQETRSTENTEVAIKAELKPEHYMVLVNDMTTQHMLLQQMESGKQFLYYYSTTTRFLDKYGNNTSVSEFDAGRIITLGEKDVEASPSVG